MTLMKNILKIIADKTFGTSYQSKKIELDLEVDSSSRIDNRESNLVNPKHGETLNHKNYISLTNKSKLLAQVDSPLKYFLDGTRHVYKIDDIVYKLSNRKMVYPVVAGQIAVGCCGRRDKKLFVVDFLNENVLALPDVSADSVGALAAMLEDINAVLTMKKIPVRLSPPIIQYSSNTAQTKTQEFENRAIAKVQERMYQLEQSMVNKIVAKNKLGANNFLVKDGSLEYRMPTELRNNKRKFLTFKKNYSYVIGVSKKFNPLLWTNNVNNRPNPDFIAALPIFARTPVISFENTAFHGDIKFAVWYLRIHAAKYTDSPFDGVVKVEKMLVTDDEVDSGKIDSDLVDTISAHLINERNPVCYGSDNRWANHIYPIFLTESFIKSKIVSAETFLHLFRGVDDE